MTGEQWEFRCERQTGVTQWRWRRRDGRGAVLREFGERFPTLEAAIEDAARHGVSYKPQLRDQ